MGNRLGRHGCARLQDKDPFADADGGTAQAIIHPPAFDRAQPAEWFAEIEEHFEQLHISSDAEKCEVLIDELDLDILQLIDNLELCSPEDCLYEKRYDNMKGIILHRLLSN